MKKVRPFYANGQTFLLISSDLFVRKVRPFHIKGLTINTSTPQPGDTIPADKGDKPPQWRVSAV